MELTQLLYFQAVADYQTVTKASKQLNITQSAISKAIGALETELGTPLFLRSNRRMTLTQEGAAFLSHVRSALNELDAGKKELQGSHRAEPSEIRVRVVPPEFLLGILESYMQENPRIRLSQSFQSPDIESALLSEELTFCIATQPIVNSSIVWEPLLTESLYLMISKKHPLAGNTTAPLSLFAHDSFIVSNSNADIKQATVRFCNLAGFEPTIAYETGETPDLLKLVDMGLGVAFCSSCIRLRHYLDEREYREEDCPYRYLRITQPQCSRTIGISYVQGRHLSETSRNFLDFIRAYFRRMERQIQSWIPE